MGSVKCVPAPGWLFTAVSEDSLGLGSTLPLPELRKKTAFVCPKQWVLLEEQPWEAWHRQ